MQKISYFAKQSLSFPAPLPFTGFFLPPVCGLSEGHSGKQFSQQPFALFPVLFPSGIIRQTVRYQFVQTDSFLDDPVNPQIRNL